MPKVANARYQETVITKDCRTSIGLVTRKESWMNSKCTDLRKRFEDTVNNENFKANNSCESLTQAERDAQRATVIENEQNFSKSLKFWLLWTRLRNFSQIIHF